MLDIATIRDVRTGGHAKVPKVSTTIVIQLKGIKDPHMLADSQRLNEKKKY